ncbi:MAG: signal peptide peptidase SppA [Candidatus Rokuibacteriota bacterium]|nr:MAG: signal peptide peptidase SppA [Candidatus Rokubacteria bacterium]
MASRGRIAAITVALTIGIVALFLGTVWLLMTVMDEGGLPGGSKVAIVEVDGIIGVGPDRSADADAIVRTLGDFRDNPSVAAIVLRINSPGGVVGPTQEIFSAVERVRAAGKPVVASLGAVAASGGYYIAVAANRIFASPGTLTGSIGVVMQLANVEGLLKKVGVDYVVIKSGAYKDLGNFARPMKPEERQVLQTLLDDVYGQFVTAVAERRGLDRKAVLTFADGRIYSGQQARALKMVDDLGGLEEAIESAAKLAGVTGKPRVIYPRRRFSLRELISGQLGLGSASGLLPALPSLKTPLYLMM